MCFVHKHMQNADFGQILSRRASTKSRVTSRPMIQFSQTWYQKMRKTWKKKVMKRRVAISSGLRAGGVKLTPPPPVKIGLKLLVPWLLGYKQLAFLVARALLHKTWLEIKRTSKWNINIIKLFFYICRSY